MFTQKGDKKHRKDEETKDKRARERILHGLQLWKTSHEKTERKARKTTRKWCRKNRNELYVSGHPRRRTSENVVGKRRVGHEEGARRQVRQKGRVH